MKIKVTGAISLLILILFIVSCESEEGIEFKRYYSSGALVYQTHCQNCHGTNGEGLAALIPPLTDSAYLNTNRAQLACNIRHGLKGQLTITGISFDQKMPPNNLSPIELAEVLTYIGNSFGNKLNTINEPQVLDDLGKCK